MLVLPSVNNNSALRKRTPNRLAFSNYTNEIVDSLNRGATKGHTGPANEAGNVLAEDWVEITGDEIGTGVYTLRVIIPLGGGTDVGAPVTSTDIAAPVAATDIIGYGLNAQEVNGNSTTGHDITALDTVRFFPAKRWDVALDGLPVYLFNGVRTEPCGVAAVPAADDFWSF